MEYFKLLPEEISLDILARLPAESSLECKLVCSDWRNIVSHHPLFYKLHLQHHNHAQDSGSKLGFIAEIWNKGEKFYYFEYNQSHELAPIERIRRISFTPPFDGARILGACNGLICFAPRSPFVKGKTFKSVCICNPIIKEYIMVPEIKIDSRTDQCFYWASGFGYVSSTNEYKVVGLCMWQKLGLVEVHIYTLGSGNGWRNLGKFNFRRGPYIGGPGIFANGALCWRENEVRMIVTFDLAEEKFCNYLSPPPLPPDNGWGYNRIGVLDGCLFFATSLVVEETTCYDIWLLRKKNDNHEMKDLEEHQSLGWTKEFRLDKSQLLAVAKSGGVLTYIDNYLKMYDTKASTSKRLVDLKGYICEVLRHKNILVSLKEMGEKDTKIMGSVVV